ncbi:MAG: hypothetical protein P8Y85_00735 [Nitrospirota bacterium]|jgi:hypothetical protein
MGSEPQWVEREILDAFYQIAVDFRSGFINDNTLKERILQAARRYERALGPVEHVPADYNPEREAWKV